MIKFHELVKIALAFFLILPTILYIAGLWRLPAAFFIFLQGYGLFAVWWLLLTYPRIELKVIPKYIWIGILSGVVATVYWGGLAISKESASKFLFISLGCPIIILLLLLVTGLANRNNGKTSSEGNVKIGSD